MAHKVTIKDIAEATGVSASTVSRILNNSGKYKEETRRKIWNAVEQMNYSPNLLAKSLRSKKSVVIGIMVPEIDTDFFSSLADLLVKKLIENDFVPIVCPTFHNPEIEIRYCHMLAALNASGIIYIHKDTPVNEAVASIPSVFIGSAPQESENSVCILFDIIGGAKLATEELLNAGCRRIVYIHTARQRDTHFGRYLGYQQALWENAVPVDESLVVAIGGNEDVSVSAALGSLMEKGISFDGIFSNTISATIEALNYLKKCALRVPEDIKLVSFENEPFVEYYDPSISAIEMDRKLACEAAVSGLKDLLQAGRTSPKVLRIPAVLYTRETSAMEVHK